MATINVYSPYNDLAPIGNGRARVQYSHDRGVSIGVQLADPDATPGGADVYSDDGGTWTDLDRNGCNNLIRALREARDKASGRDE